MSVINTAPVNSILAEKGLIYSTMEGALSLHHFPFWGALSHVNMTICLPNYPPALICLAGRMSLFGW